MSRNNNDPSNNNKEPSPRYDADVSSDDYRREPHFNRFDDDDGYEEPDRDTDLASDYRADSVEDDEYEDELPEEDERDVLATAGADPLDETGPGADRWLEKEAYLDEGEQGGRNWPLGLIATAIVALVLLIAGGYGVMQQRAATQEEIRQLRAELATAASPEDVSASRVALQDMKQSYEQLSAIAEAMKLENRRLADTVAGLEAQLGAQQAVLAKPLPQTGQAKTAAEPPAAKPIASAPTTTTAAQPAAPQPAAPQPAATKPAATEPAATATAVTTSGPWFVNFGSYASSNMAETWASRLHPDAGKVIVMPNNKDGQTLYRVRVVGLPDRNTAQEVARALEAQLRVSALWVGKE